MAFNKKTSKKLRLTSTSEPKDAFKEDRAKKKAEDIWLKLDTKSAFLFSNLTESETAFVTRFCPNLSRTFDCLELDQVFLGRLRRQLLLQRRLDRKKIKFLRKNKLDDSAEKKLVCNHDYVRPCRQK